MLQDSHWKNAGNYMKFILKRIIWLGVAIAAPLSASAEVRIQNFKMSLCSKDGQKCLEVSGAQARQSLWAPIYSFKNSQVRLFNRMSGTENTYSDASGYIDFGSEQVVLLEKQTDKLFERVFPLTTLNEIKYVVK